MVQLSDYQAASDNQVLFGGQTSVEDLNNLNKALSAGTTTGRETTNLTNQSGAPLKVESLEKTLKVLTYSENELTMWKDIPKAAAFNTVEEFNQLTSYGADRGGFNNEGELPVEEDSTYVRRAQLVKFLGVTKSVTHPMTLVNTMIGDAIDREVKNGTMWILRKLDRALYTGNQALVSQEFDGLFTQHANNDEFGTLDAYWNNTSVVVDLRGGPLTEEAIETAANSIVESFGLGTDIYSPPKVISDFVKTFYGNKFIPVNSDAITAGRVGQRVQTFESQYGSIGLHKDIFMNPGAAKTTSDGATSTSAPNAPTAGGTPKTAVGSSAQSKFATGNDGNYLWAVTAVNRYGESAITVLGTSVLAIVVGGAADLNFTATASTNPTTSFRIYRADKGATHVAGVTKYYPIFDVSTAQLAAGYDGAAALSIRDNNRWMTNCYQAMLVQKSSEIIEFKQLAPLMKMDLAVTGPAFRFMILLYGTPFLYAPKKMVRFINIGLATQF